MEEEKQEQTETKEEEKPIGLIDTAKATAERIEAANKRTEELMNRLEELMAKQLLAGNSDAGQPAPKEETPEEYAKRILKNQVYD